MRKIMVLALSMVFCFAISVPSFAVELAVDAVEKAPSSYAKVVTVVEDGAEKEVIAFGDSNMYTAKGLNQILNAY